jgi:hypothetical protein
LHLLLFAVLPCRPACAARLPSSGTAPTAPSSWVSAGFNFLRDRTASSRSTALQPRSPALPSDSVMYHTSSVNLGWICDGLLSRRHWQFNAALQNTAQELRLARLSCLLASVHCAQLCLNT